MTKENNSSCVFDPNFAVICAFFNRFAEQCGIERPDTKKLQKQLENSDDDVSPELIDLHVKLLRKIRKIVHLEKWERALTKFCYTYSFQDAWEIERFGYKKSSLSVKLKVLKALLETQFDLNTKFKNTINLITSSDLRARAIGHDKQGNAYWCFIDEKCNLKVYQENADDETWLLVASNREEMVQLIQKLKGNIPIKPCLDDLVDEDSSSNSCLPPTLVEQVKPEAMEVDTNEIIPQHTDAVQPKVEVKEPNSSKKSPEKVKNKGDKGEQSVDEEEDYKEIDEESSSEELTKLEEGSKQVVAIQKKEIVPAAVSKTAGKEVELVKMAKVVPKKPEIPEEEYSDEELEEEETDDFSSEDDLPAVAAKKPVTPTAKPAPKLLQKPPNQSEEESDENSEEYSDEYSDDDEIASGSKPAVAKNPALKVVPAAATKAKATEKVIPPPENEYSDEELDEELEEEETDFSEDESSKLIKKPQVFMKPAAKLASVSQKIPETRRVEQNPATAPKLASITKVSTPVLAKEKPKIALNKSSLANSKSDSEADYDDLEEEEDEIDDEDSEVGEEIVEPVMHIKGAGSGKANKSINTNCVENDGLELGEVIEEEILFVYGDGAGQECMIGNPGKGEETENGAKLQVDLSTVDTSTPPGSAMNSPTKSMFFFGQPGCLKNSPVKSSPSMSPQFGGGESSALNFSEKPSEDVVKTNEKPATDSDNDHEPNAVQSEESKNEKSPIEKSIPDESHPTDLENVSKPVEQPPQPTSEPIQEIPKSELKPIVSEQSASETAKDSILDDKTNGEQPLATINTDVINSTNEPNTSEISPGASENHTSKNPIDDKPVEEVSSKKEENESIKTDDAAAPIAPATINDPPSSSPKEKTPQIVTSDKNGPNEAKSSDLEKKIAQIVSNKITSPENRVRKSLNLSQIAKNLATSAEVKESKSTTSSDSFESSSKFHKMGKGRFSKVELPAKIEDTKTSDDQQDKPLDLGLAAIGVSERKLGETTPTKPIIVAEKVAEKSLEFSKSKPFKAQILEKFSSNEQAAAAAAQKGKESRPTPTISPPVQHSVSQMLNANKPRKAQILEKFSYEMKSKEEKFKSNSTDDLPSDLSKTKSPLKEVSSAGTDLSTKSSPEKMPSSVEPEVPSNHSATSVAASYRTPAEKIHSILNLSAGNAESLKANTFAPDPRQLTYHSNSTAAKDYPALLQQPYSHSPSTVAEISANTHASQQQMHLFDSSKATVLGPNKKKASTASINSLEQLSNLVSVYQNINTNRQGLSKTSEIIQKVDYSAPLIAETQCPAEKNTIASVSPPKKKPEATTLASTNITDVQSIPLEPSIPAKAIVSSDVRNEKTTEISSLKLTAAIKEQPIEQKVDQTSAKDGSKVMVPIIEEKTKATAEASSKKKGTAPTNVANVAVVTEKVTQDPTPIAEQKLTEAIVKQKPEDNSANKTSQSQSSQSVASDKSKPAAVPSKVADEKPEPSIKKKVAEEEPQKISPPEKPTKLGLGLASFKIVETPAADKKESIELKSQAAIKKQISPVKSEAVKSKDEKLTPTKSTAKAVLPLVTAAETKTEKPPPAAAKAAKKPIETTPAKPQTEAATSSRKRPAAKISDKVKSKPPPPPPSSSDHSESSDGHDNEDTNAQRSETSENSDKAGGKRARLRQKRPSPPNKQFRKEIEQRKNEKLKNSSGSSDDDSAPEEPPKKMGRPKRSAVAQPTKGKASSKIIETSKASTESPNEFIGFDEDEIATSTINKKQVVEDRQKKETEAKKLEQKSGQKGKQPAKTSPAKKTPAKGNAKKNNKEDEDPLKLENDTTVGGSSQSGDESVKSEASGQKPKKFKHLIRNLDTSLVIQTQDNETPVRTSRRIAQLKIREESDRRKMEEKLLRQMKADCVKKKRQNGADDDEVDDAEIEDKSSDFKPSDDEDSKDAEKLKRKKKSKKDNPWQTDSDDVGNVSVAEVEEEREDPEDYRMPALKSDHEFSPESDIEDEQAIPTKRARTVKKDPSAKVDEGGESEEEFSAEHTCQKCGKTDHPEWILLCDSCDHGWHCSCLSPVLFVIPEGDWHCPVCQHKQLIDNLEIQLIDYDKRLRQMELEEARQKRQALEEIEKLEKAAQEKERREQEKETRKRWSQNNSGNKKGRRRRSSSGSSSGSGSDSASSDRSKKKRRKAIKAKAAAKPKPEKEEESGSSESESSSGSGTASNSSDDEPIYKLRKRNQSNVSYRFNAYDELINLAIKKDQMDVDDEDEIVASVFGDTNAGNEGRGKDISTTVVETDKPEPMKGKGKQMGDSEAEEEEQLKKEAEDNKPSGKHMGTSSDSDEPIIEVIKKVKKKKKRLNCLDINSDEDDASDESFKGGTPDSEDEDNSSLSNASESSLENLWNKRSKKGKRKMRASTRKREKRYEEKFIDDDSSDNSQKKKRLGRKKKKRSRKEYDVLDDEREDDDDESLDSEDVDSEDLCDDTTESSGSDGGWRKKKKKKKSGGPGRRPGVLAGGDNSNSGGGGKHMPTTPKAPGVVKRKVKRVDENDKSFRAGVSTKKLKKAVKSDRSGSDSDDQPIRRTRGRQMHYTEEDYFESSDDGIKPGVKRPDTPPEEREQFIKKQEEIKRMLAEKNTEAAKQLAVPKIDVIKTPTKSAVPSTCDSLSTVPLQVIEGAKELDPDFLKPSKHNSISELSGAFENLPDDFNPEDMDEEELAKMMEEEDFAQHQLKLAGEAIARKKKEMLPNAVAPLPMSLTVLHEKEISKDMPDDINKPPKLTKAGLEPKKRGRKSKVEIMQPMETVRPKLMDVPPQAPLMLQGGGPLPHPSMGHYPPNLQPPPGGHPPQSFLSQHLQQHMKPHPMQGLPPGHHPHPGHHGPHPHMSMPPHQQRHQLMMQSHYRHPLPSRLPHHQQMHPGSLPQPPYLIHHPNRHMGPSPYGPPPPHHLSPYTTSSSSAAGPPQLPSQPIPASPSSAMSINPMIPTTVLSVSQQSPTTPQLNPAVQSVPATSQPPTASADHPADGALKKRGRRKKITPLRDDLPQADPSQSLLQMKPEYAEKMGLKAPGAPPESTKLTVAPPPQLFNPTTIGSGSVITRLLQPQRPSLFRGSNDPQPRYLAPPPTKHPQPPASHLPPDHYLGPRPSLYRGPVPPASIFGSPSARMPGVPPGYHPGSSGPPMVKPLGGAPLRGGLPPPQEYQSPYAPPPQFAGYYPPPPSQPQQLTVATHLPSQLHSQLSPNIQRRPYSPQNLQPSPYESSKAAINASPTHAPLSPAATPINDDHQPPEEQASTSEFSGLVSYFSSQHDDLDT